MTLEREPDPSTRGRPESAPSPGLLRNPDFLKLWTAETVSQFGTQVTTLAIPFVAIELLNASTFEVGLLNAVDVLPFLLIGLVAGVWVDRLRRRPILIVGDLGRALLLATIPLAYALDALTILQLYIVGFLVGSLTVFFDVAYQSYLPSLVGREHLVDGNGKLEISRASAAVLGPGFAGLLIGILRAPVAILVDSASYLGSAFFVFLIRRPEPAPERHDEGVDGPRPGMRAEIGEGLRYVVGHPFLRSIAACTASANFLGNVAWAVLMIFALRDLDMAIEAVGLAFSIGALGALAGALLAAPIASRFGVGRTIVVAAALGDPALVLFALVPAGAPIALKVGVLALFGVTSGFATVVYNVNQVSLRQAITPARLQGRMNASMRWFVWGTIPIGALLGGALGTLAGARTTLLVAAIGASLTFLPVLLSPVRGIRTMPEPVEEASTPGGSLG